MTTLVQFESGKIGAFKIYKWFYKKKLHIFLFWKTSTFPSHFLPIIFYLESTYTDISLLPFTFSCYYTWFDETLINSRILSLEEKWFSLARLRVRSRVLGPNDGAAIVVSLVVHREVMALSSGPGKHKRCQWARWRVQEAKKPGCQELSRHFWWGQEEAKKEMWCSFFSERSFGFYVVIVI